VEDGAPRVEVDAMDGVAKEEASERGLSACCHDFQVWLPVEFVVNEDTKIADQ